MFDEDFSQKATVTGTGEAGATITITNAKGEIIGSGTADHPSGAFSIPVDAPNTGGRQSLTVTQQIGDDNGGSANVDAQYGGAVTITSPVDGAHHGCVVRTQLSAGLESVSRSYIGMSRDILDVHAVTAQPSRVCFPPARPPSRGLS
ncbi:Ig-like domain-containing protein [Curtobacterium pusillum]|uniref:Ig-like domain-containing protein n=1 Tax=Curtobacterium pusillum TaxID=69373 RepID=UPI0011A6C5EC|nr:Ig-like domain-containing protein [Curtobacterium pusillum]